MLEGIAQGQGIDDSGQHPHVVGVGRIHALGLLGHPAEDVPATDHDGDLVSRFGRLGHLLRDPRTVVGSMP